jgi:molecular chaperone GrpE
MESNNSHKNIEKEEQQKKASKPAQDLPPEDLRLLREQLLRSAAENQNLRRRFAKELDDVKKYAVSKFASDLIEIYEDLNRSIESAALLKGREHNSNNKKLDILIQGIKLTRDNLGKSFNKFNIHRIYPKNQKFNFLFHEAISQVIDNKTPDNTIVNVIQAGYIIENRSLKPAKVIVSKRK